MSKDTDPPDSIARFDHEDWEEAHQPLEPVDLRDQIQGPDDWLRPAAPGDDPLFDVKSDGGLDRPTPAQQLPHELFDSTHVNQVARDPSHSRDADLRAAGVDPETVHGTSDPSEIGHPGPLGPDATEQPAAAEDEPAGQ